MKRVVSLLHRQAVRAKAEGLFFQVGLQTSSMRFLHGGARTHARVSKVVWLGIHPELVQDHPRRPKIVSQGTAVQRSCSAH